MGLPTEGFAGLQPQAQGTLPSPAPPGWKAAQPSQGSGLIRPPHMGKHGSPHRDLSPRVLRFVRKQKARGDRDRTHSQPAPPTVQPCACLCAGQCAHFYACKQVCTVGLVYTCPCLGAWRACSSVCTYMGICVCLCTSTCVYVDVCHTGLPFAHLCALMYMRHVPLVMNMPVRLGGGT